MQSVRQPRSGWRSLTRTPIVAAFLSLLGTAPAAPKTGQHWMDMDYGPFLTASIEAPAPKTNLAYKGIAIRLANAFGGTRNEAVIFDTDLLRYSAGWTGNFLALKGVAFDGEHWAYPSIQGHQRFGNPMQPGWDQAGHFQDPRPYPFGPLPRTWAHWQGLHLHGQQVILNYTVGDMQVRELPSLEGAPQLSVFARTLDVGPSTTDHTVQIAFDAHAQGQQIRLSDLRPVTASASAAGDQLAVLAPPAPTASAPAASARLQEGLIGHWEFNEGSGAVANDLSPQRRTLRFHPLGWTAEGHEGAALQFDGQHAAELEPPGDLDFLRSDLTVALWVRTAADGTLISKTLPDSAWVPHGKTLFIRDGRVTFDVGWVGAVQSAQRVADGRWHHVALTWAHADGRVTLYVDGAPDGTGRLKSDVAVPRHVVRLGFTARNFPAQPWLRGALDGLRLYQRALAPEELASLAGTSFAPELVAAGVVHAPSNTQWRVTADGHLRLQIPAHPEPARFKILLWSGPAAELAQFAKVVRACAPPATLAALTAGGPARWSPPLVTRGKRGPEDGPYAIDVLTCPEENPWNSWMRFGGVDFFPDGTRAALCTWSGDVWIVSGIDDALGKLTWQRIATGLFQPLGLKIVRDQIYVLGRDQITRLHDLNGDGEADWYENFNNDCMVSEHFHEFATDLKTDRAGNFYYIKCARHALPASHPHHGTLLKLPPDGSRLEVVARGFRAVNGLGVGPNDEITCVDNQGHWMPGNRINWVTPGGWYGNQWAWPYPQARTDYDPPLCWMHNFVDRSGGTHLWVPTDQWGPLRGELITLSYGMGHMFLVLQEEVDGQKQGGVTRFPLEFETGVMRGVFHPQTGQLYGCGLYGWAGNKTKPGEFYRIRYTGKPLDLPNALHIARDGILLGFTRPLDPSSATDPGNYDLKVWNLHWSATYGSPDFKLDGKEGRDTWPVQSATLSADRKTVFLEVPQVQPVMQMHLVVNLKAADGAPIQNYVHNTIHRLGARTGRELLGASAIASTAERAPTLAQQAPGLIQQIARRDAPEHPDTRVARLAAFYLPPQAPPTPFLEPGPVRVTWSGFLKMDLNDERVFHADGAGALKLCLNDTVVLDAPAGALTGQVSRAVPLRSGLNRLELTYESPADGPAEVRLSWSSKRLPLEPVPATVFVHDPTQPALLEATRLREGLRLFTDNRCVKCHRDETLLASPAARPDLSADAPVFDGIGDRLRPEWIAQWLINPRSFRTDSLMPAMLRGQPETIATDARDLAAFLGTLRRTTPTPGPGPVSASAAEAIAAGQKLFAELGCVGCHRLPGDQPAPADPRQSLAHVNAKWEAAALLEFLRRPTQYFRWTRMPDFQLTAEEAAALAAYVRSHAEPVPAPPNGAPSGSAERGRQLALTTGCVNCHTLETAQTQLAAPALAELARGEWNGGCLATEAAARKAAPEFAFTAEQREALRCFGRAGVRPALQRFVPAEFAEHQYRLLRCNACHGRDTETDFWSSLTADQAIALKTKTVNPFDSDEAQPDAGTVHVGRPHLSFTGEKLYANWLERLLNGVLPYKPRASLPSRMPAFPACGTGLAWGLAHQHGYGTNAPPRPAFDPNLAETGKRLTAVSDGFSCVACHDVGPQKALAGKDTATINFAHIAERLRPSYYRRYIRNPQHILPGTMMPTFIGDDGTTPIKSVLDGDPERQFAALWEYLLSLQK